VGFPEFVGGKADIPSLSASEVTLSGLAGGECLPLPVSLKDRPSPSCSPSMGTPLLQQISLRNTGLPLRTQEFHDKSGYYTHATLKIQETPHSPEGFSLWIHLASDMIGANSFSVSWGKDGILRAGTRDFTRSHLLGNEATLKGVRNRGGVVKK
jgi:hypothetical protein